MNTPEELDTEQRNALKRIKENGGFGKGIPLGYIVALVAAKCIIEVTSTAQPSKYIITPVGESLLSEIDCVTKPVTEAGGAHYGKGLQPWDLQRHMPTWGNVFIDARRTDVIEYLFRKKGDKSKQLDDAKKALHNVQEIIKDLERQILNDHPELGINQHVS